MSPEEHSKAIVHLQKLLGEQNALVQKLVKGLQPFADCVFDTGEELIMTEGATNAPSVTAYHLVRKHA